MKILIGTPTHFSKNYCFDDWADNVDRIMSVGEKHGIKSDLMIIDNSPNLNNAKKYTKRFRNAKVVNYIPKKNEKDHPPTVLCNCQNRLREEAIDGGYTHLFSLESDVFPRVDILPMLVQKKADVANVTYMIQRTMGLCVYSHANYNTAQATTTQMIDSDTSLHLVGNGDIQLGKQKFGRFMRMSGTGIGCSLIGKEVLEAIPFRVSRSHDKKTGKLTFSDSFFHLDVNNKKYKNILLTDYVAGHRYSVTKPMIMNEEQKSKMMQDIERWEGLIEKSYENMKLYKEIAEVKKQLIEDMDNKELLKEEARLNKKIEYIDAELNAQQSEAVAKAQENHLAMFMQSAERNEQTT